MNKRVIAVVITLVVLIVGAVGVYAATRPAEEPTAAGSPGASSVPVQSDEPKPVAAEEGTDVAASPGAYVDYSDTAIANAEGRIILFFHAPWCPQCRSLDSDILAAGVPAGITIIKVDYDTHQDLRQKYGVTQQTTLVEVDAAGKGLQNYLAYSDPRLAVVLDAMF